MACIDGQVLVCDLGMHSCPSLSCNSSPCPACSFMPFECRSGCIMPWVLTRARLANKSRCVGHACSLCRLLSHDACALQRAFLHLHVSSRVWASRSMSESAVLPRLSATQNDARPFQPVTQTQNPCPLVQYSTCMIDVISSECIHDARVLRCARLTIPSPTLAVCVDFSPVIRARACSTLQVSRHAACSTRNTA